MIRLMLAVAVIMLISCGKNDGSQQDAQSNTISIKGSDTMVHLVSSWAESFMNAHEGVEVSVTGGGSGTGIAALLNGTTDICAASRDIKPKEISLAEQKGIAPQEYVVALDGIAVIVHPENPVTELTIEQLGKIYTGVYENWSQVGGPDENILVLSRESSSGTYVFFQEHVLSKEDYTDKARLMPATSSIIQSVTTDKWGIGYVGFGYAEEAGESVQVLAIKETKDAEAVMPSVETVLDGSYSIARPLHLYTNGEPQGVVAEFIEFAKSPEGQEIVKETGYVSLK